MKSEIDMNVWPKLIITCNTTTGVSYWLMNSLKRFHSFCLECIEADIDSGYHEWDTFIGSFPEFLADTYGISQPAAEEMSNLAHGLDSIREEYEYTHRRGELLTMGLNALTASDGDLAYKVLQGYSDLYENDLLGKNQFELVDFEKDE